MKLKLPPQSEIIKALKCYYESDSIVTFQETGLVWMRILVKRKFQANEDEIAEFTILLMEKLQDMLEQFRGRDPEHLLGFLYLYSCNLFRNFLRKKKDPKHIKKLERWSQNEWREEREYASTKELQSIYHRQIRAHYHIPEVSVFHVAYLLKTKHVFCSEEYTFLEKSLSAQFSFPEFLSYHNSKAEEFLEKRERILTRISRCNRILHKNLSFEKWKLVQDQKKTLVQSLHHLSSRGIYSNAEIAQLLGISKYQWKKIEKTVRQSLRINIHIQDSLQKTA